LLWLIQNGHGGVEGENWSSGYFSSNPEGCIHGRSYTTFVDRNWFIVFPHNF
jgi:hypothetical protein